ncbi:MAG: TfuA-related McrA-glycine thioamidation protein [Candidatus Methanoperedenaceae archaeon]|nr:TfuA-related McrA-glycine thioamidation protein [Candidatus Methanoperedenaceae archaeon]
MRVVVYTGTSINHHDAMKILDADYRPPVKRNDIKKLMRNPPDIIGIIDGVFFDSAAVAHREIIEAIRGGVIVVGGGSMGALRASELDSYGMTGVGKIYEMYRDGVLESDDEVAVTFDADTMEALSVPLVNVRATLTFAVENGMVTRETSDAILEAAKKLFYPDRNYRNIVSESMKKGIIRDQDQEKLLGFLLEHEVDVKREDAVGVLEKIKGMI